MSVGWHRRFITMLGKKWQFGVLHEAFPLDWDGTPTWSHGQIPDDLQLCEQSSRPQKRPAIKVAQPWADKQVCCQAVATAGASRRPQAWTEHGSPYKASQSRSFPPNCTSAQECKLGVYGETILPAGGGGAHAAITLKEQKPKNKEKKATNNTDKIRHRQQQKGG